MLIKVSGYSFPFNKNLLPNTILSTIRGQETLKSLVDKWDKLGKDLVAGSKGPSSIQDLSASIRPTVTVLLAFIDLIDSYLAAQKLTC